MRLTFYGGVKEVTGANYLINDDLLVDCGLKQGSAISERQNWNPFPYNPKQIKAVLITHSHIDHIGRLPKLYKDGFRGKVYSTPPCRDFSEELLYDSQHVLSLEAKKKKLPLLYRETDIKGLMKQWQVVDYYQPLSINGLEAIFYNAGHILGSSFIKVADHSSLNSSSQPVEIVFSGDLGNSPAPIIGSKDKLVKTDYCLIESTYGDRIHESRQESEGIIEDLIEDTVQRNGTLVIPAFAMERTQQLLFRIGRLIKEKRVPSLPVFLDSPLAIKLTSVYRKYRSYFSKEAIAGVDPQEELFNFKQLHKTLTTQESKEIINVPPPKVVIAGSGMMHAGRILHHLINHLPNPNNTLLIVGFQAKRSLGRRIFEGAETVKIYGQQVPVKARVKAVGGFSAHSDQPQLLNWLKPQRRHLKKVFVVQGEETPSQVLRNKIKDELAVDAEVPVKGKVYNLL